MDRNRHPLRIEGVAFGRGTDYGVTETLTLEEAYGEVRRDVFGNAVFLGNEAFAKLVYTVSGEGVRPPALSHLRRGDVRKLCPGKYEVTPVEPGDGETTLPYDPDEQDPPFAIRGSDGARVPTIVSGRRVVIDDYYDEVVEVHWRLAPVIDFVLDAIEVSSGRNRAEASWSMTWRQV